MFDFFRRSPGRSKEMARQRLQAVLAQDRASLSPGMMDDIKEELLRTLSRYLEVDERGMEVTFASRTGGVSLVASVPVRSVRRGVRH
ncbi:MAG: cell division topological specificity factor MinE [Bacillota bacterium]|nr:cell division topological specificity factor MinE [Bacillota bacterium]